MEIRTDLALEAREMIDEKRSEKMRDKDALPKGMFVKTRENKYILIKVYYTKHRLPRWHSGKESYPVSK